MVAQSARAVFAWGAFTAEAMCAAAWAWVPRPSVLLRSVQRWQPHTTGPRADITPIRPATNVPAGGLAAQASETRDGGGAVVVHRRPVVRACAWIRGRRVC
jgi:hypothetical protein